MAPSISSIISRARSRARRLGCGAARRRAILNRGLVVARNRTRWMAAQVREFNRDTGEAATGPARLRRPLREVSEECIDQFARLPALELFEPSIASSLDCANVVAIRSSLLRKC